MKMWKRVLAAALCVLLGVSCLPDLSTFAVGYVQAKIEEITAVAGVPGVDADAEPDAGSDVVYDALLSKEPKAEPEPKDWTGYTPISTAQQLSDIRNDLGGKYYLTCDIVFTEADFAENGDFYNDGAGWIPLGDSRHPFFGAFDGDGYTIQNLFAHVAKLDTDVYAGLFGYVQNSIIRNLGLVDSDITATAQSSYYNAYAGGIAGYVDGGTFSKCYNTGSVSATSTKSYASAYAGGIAGHVYSATISECYNTGSVSASGSFTSSAGGIAGYVDGGTISECYNTGSVSASGYFDASAYAGGIAGDGGTISECYNTGSVSATSSNASAYAGGIAGYVCFATISKCYNTGSVSATSSEGYGYDSACAGGIVGYSSSANISECYNTGSVSATSSERHAYAGGIVGDICSGSVSECYNTGSVSANSSSSENYAYAGGIVGCVYSATISECYNTGSVSASGYHGSYAGGIVGYISSRSVSKCYYLDNCAKGVGYGTGSAVKCTLEQMKNPATFVGFDFGSVWTMAGKEEYPFPELQKVEMIFRREIASVEIATQPKTSYIEGQPFDDSTMTLKVTYYGFFTENDFSTEIITQGWSINGYKPDTVGSQTVTVTYQNFTVQIKVTVAKKQLVHIAVTQQPSQTEYVVGDSFNDKGMELTLYYDNETQTVVDSGWDLPDYDFSEPGQIEVKITYQGKQTALTVTVRPAAPGEEEPSDDPSGEEHVHKFGAEWKTDAERHWHECSVCGERNQNFYHVYDDEHDTVCNICGYVKGASALLGDANDDGAVNNIDASLVLQYDAGVTTFEDEALVAADVNADGAVNNIDASRILQFDAGVISGL